MRPKEEAGVIHYDGQEIYFWYTEGSRNSGPLHVFAQGSGCNHTCAAELEKLLNQNGIPTIVYDMLGSGYSSAPLQRGAYTLPIMTTHLGLIIDQVKPDNPPVIIGQSCGFMNAIDYGVRYPVLKHFGISASPNFKKTAPSTPLFHAFNSGLLQAECLTRLALHTVTSGTEDYEGCRSDGQMWWRGSKKSFKQSLAHVFRTREINTWDISVQLQNTKAELILVHGTKDPLVKPNAADQIKNFTEAYSEIIQDAGHGMLTTHPKEVMKVIEKYS